MDIGTENSGRDRHGSDPARDRSGLLRFRCRVGAVAQRKLTLPVAGAAPGQGRPAPPCRPLMRAMVFMMSGTAPCGASAVIRISTSHLSFGDALRSEEHTSELLSLMHIS